ncbi:hypothetical protein KEM54_004971, partial [Ascosphaera aggregata]
MNPLRAQQHLAAITFGPQQVRDNRTSDRYVSEIRNALTAAGIAVTEEAVVQRAWLQLDPVYRDRVPPPRPTTSITEFTEMLDSYRVAWEELAAKKAPAAEKTGARAVPRVRFSPAAVAHQVEAQEEQEEPSNLDSEPSPPESTAYAAAGPPSESQAWFEEMLEKFAQRVEAAIA